MIANVSAARTGARWDPKDETKEHGYSAGGFMRCGMEAAAGIW